MGIETDSNAGIATPRPPGSRSKRIVQFGLPYSPNLGDGVISECLAYGVAQLNAEARLHALDLSTRTGYGETVVPHRQRALRVLAALPRPARHWLVERRLGATLDRAEPGWAHAVSGADLVLIGGGQLFSDADLNFPLKIARAAKLAGAVGVPVSIYAAGVAPNWSPRGAALYRTLLGTRMQTVGLRDAPSIEAWRAQMGETGPRPVLMRDPGLLARGCYGPVEADNRIGLCVSDPAILRYHADDETAQGGVAALARGLLARGHRLRLFCNGAAEDAMALAALARDLAPDRRDGRVEIAQTPTRPVELARLVGGCRAVIAHRLHACILAYAYRRPVVGLGWDRKVESFFASVDLSDAFSPAGEPATAVVARLERRLACPVDTGRADAVEGEVSAGLNLAITPVLPPP